MQPRGADPQVFPMQPGMPTMLPPGQPLTLEYLAGQVGRLNLAVYGYPENNIEGLLKFREAVEAHMKQMNKLQWWFAGLSVGLGVNTLVSIVTLLDGKLPLP